MRQFLLIAFAIAVAMQTRQRVTEQAPRRYEPPAVIASADVIYPLQSVASGTVVLEVTLDDTAKITDVRVVRGIASLTESAERSVLQWKFQAAKFDGRPVPSKIPVAFSFVPPNFGPRF